MSRDRDFSYRSRVSAQSQRSARSARDDSVRLDPQQDPLDSDIIPYQCPEAPYKPPLRGSVAFQENARQSPSQDSSAKTSRVQTMKLRLDELEPKVNSIDERLACMMENVESMKQQLMSRKKESEDVQNGLLDRLTKADQKVDNFRREISDYKVDAATESATLKQTITSLNSEITCLKTWILENLRQIHSKLDGKDREHSNVRNSLHERISGCEQGCAMKIDELECLRAEVDAKFAAVKEALSKTLRHSVGPDAGNIEFKESRKGSGRSSYERAEKFSNVRSSV